MVVRHDQLCIALPQSWVRTKARLEPGAGSRESTAWRKCDRATRQVMWAAQRLRAAPRCLPPERSSAQSSGDPSTKEANSLQINSMGEFRPMRARPPSSSGPSLSALRRRSNPDQLPETRRRYCTAQLESSGPQSLPARMENLSRRSRGRRSTASSLLERLRNGPSDSRGRISAGQPSARHFSHDSFGKGAHSVDRRSRSSSSILRITVSRSMVPDEGRRHSAKRSSPLAGRRRVAREPGQSIRAEHRPG